MDDSLSDFFTVDFASHPRFDSKEGTSDSREGSACVGGMGVTVKRLWFQADQILKLEHVGTILNLISGMSWNGKIWTGDSNMLEPLSTQAHISHIFTPSLGTSRRPPPSRLMKELMQLFQRSVGWVLLPIQCRRWNKCCLKSLEHSGHRDSPGLTWKFIERKTTENDFKWYRLD